MAELRQSFSHFKVIDASPPKRINISNINKDKSTKINEWINKMTKRSARKGICKKDI